MHCGLRAILYALKPQNILLGLFPTMRLKIQLSAHDVEFQRLEQAKADQMRRQLLIPQEKIPSILKFKSPTFIFPPLKDIVPPKNNHLPYSLSILGSFSFVPQKNLFSFSKTTPFGLERGKINPFWFGKRKPLHPSSFIFLLLHSHHYHCHHCRRR